MQNIHLSPKINFYINFKHILSNKQLFRIKILSLTHGAVPSDGLECMGHHSYRRAAMVGLLNNYAKSSNFLAKQHFYASNRHDILVQMHP